VARELELRLVETICVASYDHQTQGEAKVIKGLDIDSKGWLVIDDLVDTGQTAKAVRKMLPDTQALHWVCHNNLGLRQHRNFSEKELEASTTLAFSGDSFTENLRIPAVYSFTEPLDYLLNIKSNSPYTTLNYGVDGYGTDQSYIYYQEAAAKTRLDHVFYLFTANDFRNIFENKLFTLEDKKQLKQNPPQESSWIIRFISKLHLTYLAIETVDHFFYNSTDLNKRIHLQTFINHSKTYHSEEADAIEAALRANSESAQLQKKYRPVQQYPKTPEDRCPKSWWRISHNHFTAYNRRQCIRVNRFRYQQCHQPVRALRHQNGGQQLCEIHF